MAGTAAVQPARAKQTRSSLASPPTPVAEVLTLAQEQGLLTGSRTTIIRGRMPAPLVARAKRKTGIQSDSRLLEVALASLAVADDYAEWLLAQGGTVDPDLDLEF